MEKITVAIYTHNEEKNITEVIESAKLLSSEILVIDMESSDKTVTIAKSVKAKVISFPYSSYVEPTREFGIKQAKTEWVLILDADERMTKELAAEIKRVIHQSPAQFYKIPRKNIFAKIKWLKNGGWWPDNQIRLINKKNFISWPKRIHSTPEINGQPGYLNNPIIHYFHGDLSGMVKKTVVFEDIESDLLFKADKKSGTVYFFRKFFAELYRRLIKNLGFADGAFGIIEAIYQAYSKTITYLFLYEKQSKEGLPAGRQGRTF